VQLLHEELEGDTPIQVVDVREHSEWEEGHIDGAINLLREMSIPNSAASGSH